MFYFASYIIEKSNALNKAKASIVKQHLDQQEYPR